MEQTLIEFLQQFPVLAPVLFIVIRASALIIPPIPGLLIDSAGILLFGWPTGFIYAWIGLVAGAMGAFYIARIFRDALLRRFTLLRSLAAAEHTLNSAQEFWTLVLMRVFTNPLLDYINFIAGFTRVSPLKFFITTIIGYFPYTIIVYFFGAKIVQHTGVQIAGIMITVLIMISIYRKYLRTQK